MLQEADLELQQLLHISCHIISEENVQHHRSRPCSAHVSAFLLIGDVLQGVKRLAIKP